MGQSDARYRIETARIEDRHLVVGWGDGHESRFHPVWLRHQCECKLCGTPVNAVRGLRLHHIPGDIAPALHMNDRARVQLEWSNDRHRSTYAARWLRDHCYSARERRLRKHRPTLWDGRIAADPPRAAFSEAESVPSTRLAMLEAVRDAGFCVVSDVPTDPGQAHRLIELVGPQRRTHFGTYRLTNKATVDNVGDITAALDPHTDETYRLSAIGVTVFQVLRPSVDGGHSTLVDGFEAVRRLRDAWPADFELLTRVPIAAQRLDHAHNSGGQARWYAASLPVIKVDFDGDLCGVRLNERQIGPLDLDPDLIEPCYRALGRLFELAYDPDLRVTFALQQGEGLLFDNQRVLHGRTAFTPEAPARSVLTSSVDLEDFHSTLRLLQRDLGRHDPPLRLRQGMAA